VSETKTCDDRTLAQATDLLKRHRFDELLGPLKKYLDDPLVLNINVNEDGGMFIERFGDGKLEADAKVSEDMRRGILSYLANAEGKVIDALQSSLSVRMPYYGSRVRGFAPPIARWAMVIRQHAPTIPLATYLERDLITESRAAFLRESIASEHNIIVAGKQNSGKTSFMRSLLDVAAEVRPMHRPVIVQKDDELPAEKFRDKLFLFARVPQATAGMHGTTSHYTYGFTDALEDALQTNANFLIWGELRDGASAVGLTMALNTGTRGFMTTIHADSAEETLHRVEDLLLFEGKPIVRRMLAKFVNVIVFMDYDLGTGKRWVSDIVEVLGIDGKGDYTFKRH
jgi:Flp pilus assembly CpaF family ATPase